MKKRLLITEEEKFDILEMYQIFNNFLYEQVLDNSVEFDGAKWIPEIDGTKLEDSYYDKNTNKRYGYGTLEMVDKSQLIGYWSIVGLSPNIHIYKNPNNVYYVTNSITEKIKNKEITLLFGKGDYKPVDKISNNDLTETKFKTINYGNNFGYYFNINVALSEKDKELDGVLVYKTKKGETNYAFGKFLIMKDKPITHDNLSNLFRIKEGIVYSENNKFTFEGTFKDEEFPVFKDGFLINKNGCKTEIKDSKFISRKVNEALTCTEKTTDDEKKKTTDDEKKKTTDDEKKTNSNSTTEELFKDANDENVYSVCNLKNGKVVIGFNEKSGGMNSGPLVKFIQRLLNNWNDEKKKIDKNLDEDGLFGKKTTEMTIAFQNDKSITPDGDVGPITYSKFNYPDNC